MKKLLILTLIMSMVLSLSGCGQKEKPLVTLSVWGGEMDQVMLEAMVQSFAYNYRDEADFQITVCEESEETCKDTVLFSPKSAADVYSFADDQLVSLVDEGALLPVSDENKDTVINDNGGVAAVAVAAASYQDKIYGFPMSASNGYFLYYNSDYISESEVGSLTAMMDAAAQEEKKVAMDMTSGWYLYSFFRAAGMDVQLQEDGKNFCNFNSKTNPIKGVDVARAIRNIDRNPGFINCNSDGLIEELNKGNVVAAVSGTWNESAFKNGFGNGYRATKLPTFSVNGQELQMHSVVGYKLLGVNAYTKEPYWAQKLAMWLTNEENQLKRFEQRGDSPSNVNAAANPKIKVSEAISALTAQVPYGHLQKVADTYWDPMYRMGNILASDKEENRDLQSLLDETVEAITE